MEEITIERNRRRLLEDDLSAVRIQLRRAQKQLAEKLETTTRSPDPKGNFQSLWRLWILLVLAFLVIIKQIYC